jgi:hypothetical protein
MFRKLCQRQGVPRRVAPACLLLEAVVGLLAIPLLVASRTSIAVAQDRRAKPDASFEFAVWELCDMRRTWRVILFQDGKTSEKELWSQEGLRLKIGSLDGRLSQDRMSVAAENVGPGGGNVVTGKLVLINALIATKPLENAAKDEPKPAAPDKRAKKSLQDTMPGTFQLVGNARGGKKVDLPVTFRDDRTLIDGTGLLGQWTAAGRQVKIEFSDKAFGEVTLSGNGTEFRGRSTSPAGDKWTWSMNRVRVTAVWDTNGAGSTDRVTLYSNGRVNKPAGEGGAGHWWLDGRRLQLWSFACELRPDGRAFTGHAPHGGTLEGRLLSGGFSPHR